MQKKLSRRQVKALVEKFLEGSGGDDRNSPKIEAVVAVHASENGCEIRRGRNTKNVCRNMSRDKCLQLDFELKQINPNYYAVPLLKPCE